MPTIELKPNSPEYADDENPQEIAQVQLCDMPDCGLVGENRAPKDRALREYYYFCEAHAREYNSAWDYFDGLSPKEEKEAMEEAHHGGRKTWKRGAGFKTEEELRAAAGRARSAGTEHKPKRPKSPLLSPHTPEGAALASMDLQTPITLDDIKSRYRELAKLHHPDRNFGCKKAEEKLKHINMAYTILKLAWSRWEKLQGNS